MTQEELKLVLKALEGWCRGFPDLIGDLDEQAITAIKEALAQPEQEPVALPIDDYFVTWSEQFGGIGFKESMPNANYKITVTAVPQRTWVDLTRTQMQDVYFAVLEEHRGGHQMQGQLAFGEALQAKIKERNT